MGAPAGFTESCALAINNDGVIAGWARNPYGIYRACIFIPDGADAGWHSLTDSAEGAPFPLERATGIDDHGAIVGYSEISSKYGKRAFLLQPIAAPTIEAYIREQLATFIVMFGGAEKGGSGWVITPGGKPRPIPPHEPKVVTSDARDAAIGMVLQQLAVAIGDRASREELRRTAERIVERAAEKVRSRESLT